MKHTSNTEIWDLYSENRELLGRDHVRGEQLPLDGFHLVVHVWIRNSKGEYLISQRSANRQTYPLMWECVGGSVVKGEPEIHRKQPEDMIKGQKCKLFKLTLIMRSHGQICFYYRLEIKYLLRYFLACVKAYHLVHRGSRRRKAKLVFKDMT